ncbi:MAG TPA: hypothetical protein VFX60_08825 [Micromonospora sp.]|nr:hypothetical protein [Micromonospora sp.]
MAVRGSGRSIATAVGAAAGAGAAQLGLGYGLGIVGWLASDDNLGTGLAGLTWVVWIAATSAVIGAVCAEQLATAGEGRTSLRRRVALAVAAAVGALITVALVAVPAHSATPTHVAPAQMVAAGYAAVGVALGLVVALWALSSRAVANNLIATISWLWLLALLAIIEKVALGRTPTDAQLGIWQINSDSGRFFFRGYLYWPGAVLSLGTAVVIGVLAARGPARRPEARVGAAVSGAAGPLLVAAAYFFAAPRLVEIPAGQISAYLSAHLTTLYAALAGLAGSVIVAALAQRPRATTPPLIPTQPTGTEPPAAGSAPDPEAVPEGAAGEPGPGGEDRDDETDAPAASDQSDPSSPDPATDTGTPEIPAPASSKGNGKQDEPKRKPRRTGRRTQ